MIEEILTERELRLLKGAAAPRGTMYLLTYMFAKIKKLEKQIEELEKEK